MKKFLTVFFGLQILTASAFAQFTSSDGQKSIIVFADCEGAKVMYDKLSRMYHVVYSVNGEELKAYSCSAATVRRGITPELHIKCYDLDIGNTLVYESNSIGLKTLTLLGPSGDQKVNCR